MFCVYVYFIWKRNDKQRFEWGISAHCMVNLSYHYDLTSLFGPPREDNQITPVPWLNVKKWVCETCAHTWDFWQSYLDTTIPRMQEGKATEDNIEKLRTWVSTARLRFGGKRKTACALSVKAVPPHLSKRYGPRDIAHFQHTKRLNCFHSLRCVAVFGVGLKLSNMPLHEWEGTLVLTCELCIWGCGARTWLHRVLGSHAAQRWLGQPHQRDYWGWAFLAHSLCVSPAPCAPIFWERYSRIWPCPPWRLHKCPCHWGSEMCMSAVCTARVSPALPAGCL